MRRAGLTSVATCLLAIAPCSVASAADPNPSASPASEATRPSGSTPTLTVLPGADLDAVTIPEGGIPPGSVEWRPWTVFDPYFSPRSFVLSGGPAWERFIGQGYENRGFEVTLGRSIETPPEPRPFRLRMEADVGLRVTNPSHWVLSLLRYSYAGALVVGPVELAGRAGFTVAEVHWGTGGFGLGFLSPRVSASASIDVGRFRLGAVAFSEVAWRWVGGPNAVVQGFLLELGLGRDPDGLPPMYRVKN